MLRASYPKPSALGLAVSAALILASSAAARPGVAVGSACGSGPELRAAYLRCESLARSDALGAAGIAECSVLYEALKAGVFEGSFPALRAWYETAKELPKRNAPVVVFADPGAEAFCGA